MRTLVLLIVASLAAGCLQVTDDQPNSFIVDSEGGRYERPDGLVLTIPAGAVSPATRISTERIDAPDLLRARATGPAWRLGPEGTKFALPIEIAFPVDAQDRTRFVATASSAAGPFEELPTRMDALHAVVSVSHFSVFVPIAGGGADAGTTDAGLDAGSDSSDAGVDAGIVDTDAGEPGGCFEMGVWDAGVPVCGPSSTIAGPCSRLYVWNGYYAFGARRDCGFNAQLLECRNGNCICQSPSGTTSFPMPNAPEFYCDLAIQRLWECQCGFGAIDAGAPECTPAFGVADAGPYGLPMGSACANPSDCQYAFCINWAPTGPICSTYSPYEFAGCPCGWQTHMLGTDVFACVPP